MTKKEVFELFKFIVSFYPHFEVTQEKIDNWALIMKDQNFDRVMFRVRKHVETEKFPPTPSELVETIDETRNKNFSDKVKHMESEALGYCPFKTSDIERLLYG